MGARVAAGRVSCGLPFSVAEGVDVCCCWSVVGLSADLVESDEEEKGSSGKDGAA